MGDIDYREGDHNRMSIRVREMALEDIDEVCAIGRGERYFSTAEDESLTVGFWPRETIERWIGDENDDIALIATDDTGAIRGFVLLTVHSSNRKAELENIWVHPRCRGRHISTDLIEDAIRRVKLSGVADCIVALTELNNKIIQSALQKRFKFTKGRPHLWMSLRIKS